MSRTRAIPRPAIFSIVCFWLPLVVGTQVPAQEDSSPRISKTAIIQFDLDLAKLRENDLVKASRLMNAAQRQLERGAGRLAEEMDLAKVNRIRGGFQAPQSMDQLNMMGPGSPLPFNFFVQFQFADSESVQPLLETIRDDSMEHEFNGQTFYSPPGNEVPNLRAHLMDERTFEIGTKAYLYRPDRNVFTDGARRRMEALPEEAAIRLAVDIDAAQVFYDQLIKLGRQNAPPQAMGIVQLASNLSGLSLSLDLESDSLLILLAEGKDEEAAGNLKSGLDGLLQLVRLQLNGAISRLDDDSAEVVRAIAEALETNREGTTVTLDVPRPAGFKTLVETVGELANQASALDAQMNRARQAALAVLNYESAHGRFPFLASGDQNANLSWRVRILPYLEESELYDSMDVRQAWDDEPNRQHLGHPPQFFRAPEDAQRTDIVCVQSDVKSFAGITDGSSNTIMLLLVPDPVEWLKPNDISIDDARELITSLEPGESIIVVLYDGSVRQISAGTDPEVVHAMLPPNGGEVIRKP